MNLWVHVSNNPIILSWGSYLLLDVEDATPCHLFAMGIWVWKYFVPITLFNFPALSCVVLLFQSPNRCIWSFYTHKLTIFTFNISEKQIDLVNANFKKMKVKELKKILSVWGEDCKGCTEKSDFITKIETLLPKYAPDAHAARLAKQEL